MVSFKPSFLALMLLLPWLVQTLARRGYIYSQLLCLWIDWKIADFFLLLRSDQLLSFWSLFHVAEPVFKLKSNFVSDSGGSRVISHHCYTEKRTVNHWIILLIHLSFSERSRYDHWSLISRYSFCIMGRCRSEFRIEIPTRSRYPMRKCKQR